MDKSIYEKIVVNIIKQQESLIGPVAVERAKQVEGLNVDWSKQSVTLAGDMPKVIDALVEQYKLLFGQISVEVCKEAMSSIASSLTPEQIPSSLR